MGCHTWSHKLYKISLEESKQAALAICDHHIKWNAEYINDPKKQKKWEKDFGEFNIDEFIYAFNVFTRCKRFIEKGIFKTKRYFCSFFNDSFEGKPEGVFHFCERNNELYLDDHTTQHDIFRIGGYPEDQLLSYDETITFIENYCLKYGVKVEEYFDIKKVKLDLKKYWDENPNGMICFG